MREAFSKPCGHAPVKSENRGPKSERSPNAEVREAIEERGGAGISEAPFPLTPALPQGRGSPIDGFSIDPSASVGRKDGPQCSLSFGGEGWDEGDEITTFSWHQTSAIGSLK